MRCIYVRWKGPLPAKGLEYFDNLGGHWGSCTAQMVKFWLHEGHSIWMNPQFEPAALEASRA